MAVSKGYKKDDGAMWFNCIMFGERCEKLAQYLVKGTKVICEGSLQLSSYEAKDGTKKYSTDIYIDNLEFVGGKADGNTHNEAPKDTNTFADDSEITPIDDGDIPF